MSAVAVPHRLYRCYDADNRLIYIGSTSLSVKRRMANHRRGNPAVWSATHRTEAEEYPDKGSARAAERQAIRREMPLLNVQHNTFRKLAGPDVTPEQWSRQVRHRIAVMTGGGTLAERLGIFSADPSP